MKPSPSHKKGSAYTCITYNMNNWGYNFERHFCVDPKTFGFRSHEKGKVSNRLITKPYNLLELIPCQWMLKNPHNNKIQNKKWFRHQHFSILMKLLFTDGASTWKFGNHYCHAEWRAWKVLYIWICKIWRSSCDVHSWKSETTYKHVLVVMIQLLTVN